MPHYGIPLIHCPRWRGGKARRGVSGQFPDSRLRPIFDLQPEADQRRGVSEWWGRRGGGVYSVVGRGFLFCLVGRSGDGRRSYVDDAPFTIQRGFGRPGVRTLQARYPICSTAAWTRPGSAVRHGSYTWVGCTALKQPKGGPGPAVGPTGVICPTLPKRPGAGSNGGNDLDTGGTEDFSARSGPSV